MMFAALKRQTAHFLRDEEGSQIVEMLLMTPVLVWAFVATLQYFDAFRTELITNKAALTIADMVSREAVVDSNYFVGVDKLLKFLTLTDTPPTMRVTLFYWDEPTKKYKVTWSKGSATVSAMDDATLNGFATKIPLLSNQEKAILVQTYTTYEPKFGSAIFGVMKGASLTTVDFKTFLVISPRFTPSVCFDPHTGNALDVKC